jgi:hypothetical protein
MLLRTVAAVAAVAAALRADPFCGTSCASLTDGFMPKARTRALAFSLCSGRPAGAYAGLVAACLPTRSLSCSCTWAMFRAGMSKRTAARSLECEARKSCATHRLGALKLNVEAGIAGIRAVSIVREESGRLERLYISQAGTKQTMGRGVAGIRKAGQALT